LQLIKKGTLGILLLGLLTTGCKERFEPKILKSDISLLVVDGFLNNSKETTEIRLSRTSKLGEGQAGVPELNAQLFVEDEDGSIVYYFQESFNGSYIVPGMNLDTTRKYRLKINTAGGKQYASDAIPVKQTPPIDSVNWKRLNDGIGIYVNTHDPLNETKYYRWDFTETWEDRSNNFSYLSYTNGAIVPRKPGEFVYYCWQTFPSQSLLLGSSAKLSQDVISEYPLNLIPLNSIQISVKYSINVRQFALTKEGFEYFENIKKITEQMGSIFDAQPSQLMGNIHCIGNPGEPVLGYATAGTQMEKRIFISNRDVLPWKYSLICEPPHLVTYDSLEIYFTNGFTPIEEPLPPAGILGNTTACVDCTSRGGSNIKPDFWQ
jgi:hypothetical protein